MTIWDWQNEKIEKAVRNLFKQNLCAQKEEKILILSDTLKERIGEIFFNFGLNYVNNLKHVTYPPTGRHGLEPPEIVWTATFGREFTNELKSKELFEKVKNKEITENDEEEIKEILLETTSPNELPSAIVAVNQHSISHTIFRKLCTEFLSIRFASMPLFEPFMFNTAFQANWEKVEKLSRKIAELLTQAEEVEITCPNGTAITMSLKDREGLADTGRLCKPGDFGNLPAGEAFIAPVEGTAKGVFVTFYAPDRKLKEPVKITVEGGKVVKAEGEEEFSSYINQLIHREKNADNIAELGIGTNEKAVTRTNILEAEKILGTCHIAIGDNSAFGGKVKANVHIDMLIEEPTVILKVDKKKVTLMENGNLNV